MTLYLLNRSRWRDGTWSYSDTGINVMPWSVFGDSSANTTIIGYTWPYEWAERRITNYLVKHVRYGKTHYFGMMP